MPDVLRVVLGRLIGALVAGLVTWLAGKGIKITAENVEAVVSALVTLFTVLYSIGHTIINARINPKDVSSPTIAGQTINKSF